MPITISLLNSLSGVAGAIAGLAIRDPLLVAIEEWLVLLDYF